MSDLANKEPMKDLHEQLNELKKQQLDLLVRMICETFETAPIEFLNLLELGIKNEKEKRKKKKGLW